MSSEALKLNELVLQMSSSELIYVYHSECDNCVLFNRLFHLKTFFSPSFKFSFTSHAIEKAMQLPFAGIRFQSVSRMSLENP